MVAFLHYLFLGILTFFAIVFVIITVYVRYTYGYWKRRKIPYMEPTFPFGNGDQFVPKGFSIGAVSKKFYDEFKSIGHMAGGKSDLNNFPVIY